MNLEQLFEFRSTSLTKLAKDSALAVATEHPIEMARIMFTEFKKAGLDIDKKEILQYIAKIGNATSGNSLSNRNPWLDTNNENEINFTDNKSGHEVELRINFRGNEGLIGTNVSYLRSIDKRISKPINADKTSASDFFAMVSERISALIKSSPGKHLHSQDEISKVYAASEKFLREVPKIVEILQPIARKYLMKVGVQREGGDEDRIYIRPSFSKFGIGGKGEINWGELNSKYGWNDGFHNFVYSFQYEMLLDAWPKIVKRIKDNGFLILNGGFNGEYIFMKISAEEGEAISPAYRRDRLTNNSVHDEYVKYISNSIEKATEKVDDENKITLQQYKRILVIDAVSNEKTK